MYYASELYKHNGFKLLSLDLRGNSLMGKSNLYYSFIDPKDKQQSIYTTVIIGPNGTGKSNLFRIIIELLKELNDLSRGRKRSYNVDGNFNLKFSVNGEIFEYATIISEGESIEYDGDPEKGNKAFLLRNGEAVNFEEALLPISIVANSIMLTDKYPFYKKENNENNEKEDAFPQYKYLGVRSIAQSASTRAYIRRTVEFIVELFEKKDSNKRAFISALKRATEFLEIDNSIAIFYYTSNNAKFFKGDLTPSKLDGYFESIKEKYPRAEDNPPFKLNQYLKIKPDEVLIQSICDFCNKLVTSHRLEKLPYKHSSIRKISYNLIESALLEQLNEDFVMLEHLRQLGIISAPEIQLKRADGYSLQESSSGEYHFFSSVVGLLATVKMNSLIFIDEPEISLHPNWQMKYLSFIRELFGHSEYATCHVLIATHSHFLISDLRGDSSKIIGLKRMEGKVQIVDIFRDIDTFGWSAEDVLYNIFNVASTRNKFVADDIAKILEELSSGDESSVNKLSKEKYNEIIELEAALKESDPFKRVVKAILTKVSG